MIHLTEHPQILNTCGQYFTADLLAEVLDDEETSQKYGHSARSLMALDKFFAVTPYYCQEALQSLLGVNLSASTVFDQTELIANRLVSIYNILLQQGRMPCTIISMTRVMVF